MNNNSSNAPNKFWSQVLLEIFGGVVGQGTISGTKNSVGRVLGVVFQLEYSFLDFYIFLNLKIKPSNQKCF